MTGSPLVLIAYSLAVIAAVLTVWLCCWLKGYGPRVQIVVQPVEPEPDGGTRADVLDFRAAMKVTGRGIAAGLDELRKPAA